MSLKFININSWHGGKFLMPNLLAFLREHDPDIVSMQEVNQCNDRTGDYTEPYLNTVKTIKSAGFPHAVYAPAFRIEYDGGVRVPHGNAIFSKYPLSQKQIMFFDRPYSDDIDFKALEKTHDFSGLPRNILHAVTTIDGRELNIFDTHGIWGTDGKANPRRIAMSRAILDVIGDTAPAILSGDFNAQENTRTINMIGEKLINVFEPDNRTTSFNMKHKPADSGYATAVVDFAFVTRDITVHSHSQPNANISDHLPQIVEFSLPTSH